MTKDSKDGLTALNENLKKSMDEFAEMGLKAQDEMFKMAHQQMESYRQLTEKALKDQADFFGHFERNARATRDMFVKGIKTWTQSIEGLQKKS